MKVPGMHLYPRPLQGRGQYELEVPGHTPRVGPGVSRDFRGPPHGVGTTSASCLTLTREGLFQVSELSGQRLDVTVVNMSKALTDGVGSMQEQMGSASREVGVLRKTRRKC